MSRIRRWETWLVAIAAFFGTALMFWEYLPFEKKVHLWSDISWYHYPLQSYAFASLKAGRFPLWDPSIYCGMSFVANIQAALFYPPTWLLYAVCRPFETLPFKAYEIFTLAHVWLAFVLAYRWLRGRVGAMPSALGAMVFACGGFLVYELLHPGVVCATAWIPLGLLAIDQAAERRDWRPLWKLAAASALAFLAGYPSSWIGDCLLWFLYAASGRAALRTAAGAAAAIGGSLLLSMAQLLPAMEAASMMVPEPKYGVGPWSWKTLLVANLFPNWLDLNPGHPGNYEPGCIYFYLGLPALFGLVAILSRRPGRALAQPAVCLAAVFLFANPPEMLARVVERFPTLEGAMSSFHLYSGVSPMAALLAALAMDAFLRRPKAGREVPRAVAWTMAAALAVWSKHLLEMSRKGGQLPAGWQSIEWTAAALALFGAAMWVYRRTSCRDRGLLAMLLLVTAMVDYKAYGSARWFNAQPGDVDEEHVPNGIRGVAEESYGVLMANRTYRVFLDEGAAPRSTDLRLWRLSSPQGFDPFLPAQYRSAVERHVRFKTNREFFPDLHKPEMFDAFGVRYVFTHQGAGSEVFLAKNDDFRRISGQFDSFYRVYEHLHARAPYRWAESGEGSAGVAGWTPERRELDVNSESGGRFVLVEQFYPGWRATVDGRGVAIERWEGAFQAVPVPPGAHRVTFTYRPERFGLAVGVSGAALAALLAIAWMDSRRGRPAMG